MKRSLSFAGALSLTCSSTSGIDPGRDIMSRGTLRNRSVFRENWSSRARPWPVPESPSAPRPRTSHVAAFTVDSQHPRRCFLIKRKAPPRLARPVCFSCTVSTTSRLTFFPAPCTHTPTCAPSTVRSPLPVRPSARRPSQPLPASTLRLLPRLLTGGLGRALKISGERGSLIFRAPSHCTLTLRGKLSFWLHQRFNFLFI